MALSRVVAQHKSAKSSLTDNTVTWAEYARVIHLILNGFGKGIDVDFMSRNLVGVGHSMGASAMSALAFSVCVICRLNSCYYSILTRTIYPFVPWSSAILVEPMFLHPDFMDRIGKFLPEGATKRRDVWPSREEAKKLFRERSFKTWDPRAIDLYVVRIRFMLSDALGPYCRTEIWPTRAPNLDLPRHWHDRGSHAHLYKGPRNCALCSTRLPTFL